MIYDVAVVGAGPAGSTCAAFCAAKGLQVAVVEREKFPREKVCGDCINPACWPVLRRLGVDRQVRSAPNAPLNYVEFIDLAERSLRIALPEGDAAEIAIKRSVFDSILLARVRELGAEVREATTVTAITRANDYWILRTSERLQIHAHILVAADGRNSTAARLLGFRPRIARERVALQAHLPLPRNFGARVVLQLLPGGYSGQAPVGEGELNVCLVGPAAALPGLRRWAARRFNLGSEQNWRTVTPLTRRSISPVHDRLFFIGDAARVVEPFTGEGIFYALNSGEIAAQMVHRLVHDARPALVYQEFCRAYQGMYRERILINKLARAAVLSPRLASSLFTIAHRQPRLLSFLTNRIVR